jgi:hypothetical protein
MFSRPDLTERVLRHVARANPPRVYVVADGPRPGHPHDAEKCVAARAVVDRIDWGCEVIKNYSDTNLGCGRRPATGISWVFEQVDRAIILEDDCIPAAEFFPFCDELLERYRDDERIMQVSGNNMQLGNPRTEDSYYFSWHNICWGWASWRRAWRFYDMSIPSWPALRDSGWLSEIVRDPEAVEYWQQAFDKAYTAAGDVDFWDYQWTFACWAQHGLSISPSATLVTNVGFRPDATHTTWLGDQRAALPIERLNFPLRHPACVTRNLPADEFFVREMIVKNRPKPIGRLSRIRRTIGKAIPDRIHKPIAHRLWARGTGH